MTEEIRDELIKANKRRLERDKDILRKGCMDTMRIFKPDCREWILGECKDLQIMLEKLVKSKNSVVSRKAKKELNNVKKIHASYSKNIISPLTKIEKGNSGAKSNVDYCETLKSSLDNALDIIKRLFEIRECVDDLVEMEFNFEFDKNEENDDTPDYIK